MNSALKITTDRIWTLIMVPARIRLYNGQIKITNMSKRLSASEFLFTQNF